MATPHGLSAGQAEIEAKIVPFEEALSNPPVSWHNRPRMASYALYLHIPFCRRRCSYCDFNTYTTLGGLQEAYTAALAREIRQVGALARAAGDDAPGAHTIFFGGGTPSLLSPRQVETILTAAREAFAVAPEAEITMEANPGTVDEAYLSAVRALGVNRLSYGVQSALPGELALLGREHDFDQAVAAVGLARAAGFDNLNLDLIYGLPGQSVADWRRTLAAVLPLAGVTSGVTHISLYCLTIEPGTPMHRWLHDGTIRPPDPDVAADQYELAGHELARAGFGHYEISNWALPGRECRHNLVYWRNEPYLGLGAGAHGMAGGYRYQVVRQPRAYIRRVGMTDDGRPPTADDRPLPDDRRPRTDDRRPWTDDRRQMTDDQRSLGGIETVGDVQWVLDDHLPMHDQPLISGALRSAVGGQRSAVIAGPFPLSAAVAAYHVLGRDEAMSDTAITQLRLLEEGLDLNAFAERFGQTFDEVYGDAVRQLEGWGLLRRRDGRLLLTENGRFLSNQVFHRFV
jgi:oxygen-independent coproporphyrinogen-3 oxidase